MRQSDDERTEDELHRRDLSRLFLGYFRKTTRLKAEYKVALHDLAGWPQIIRKPAELEQELDHHIDLLLDKCADPARIESEIHEGDATSILETEGAFEPCEQEDDPDEVAEILKRLEETERHPESSIPHDAVWARVYADIEEHKRTIWRQSFANQNQALEALRWSGFRGPVFEAYWNEPTAWISCSIGVSRHLQSTGLQFSEFLNVRDAVEHILGAQGSLSRVAIIHSENPLVTLDWIDDTTRSDN